MFSPLHLTGLEPSTHRLKGTLGAALLPQSAQHQQHTTNIGPHLNPTNTMHWTKQQFPQTIHVGAIH